MTAEPTTEADEVRPEWVKIVDSPELAVTDVGGHPFGSVAKVLRWWKPGCPVVRSGPLARRPYDVTLLRHAWEPASPPVPETPSSSLLRNMLDPYTEAKRRRDTYTVAEKDPIPPTVMVELPRPTVERYAVAHKDCRCHDDYPIVVAACREALGGQQ